MWHAAAILIKRFSLSPKAVNFTQRKAARPSKKLALSWKGVGQKTVKINSRLAPSFIPHNGDCGTSSLQPGWKLG